MKTRIDMAGGITLEEYPDQPLKELYVWVTDKWESIPEDKREHARLKLRGLHEDSSCCLDVYYERDETEEERSSREANEIACAADARRRQEAQEREMLLLLKAKYER
jgi:hypothetical protein